MCVQCAMGAMVAGSAATGIRAWVEVRAPGLLTSATVRKTMNVSLMAIWILGAGLLGTGSG